MEFASEIRIGARKIKDPNLKISQHLVADSTRMMSQKISGLEGRVREAGVLHRESCKLHSSMNKDGYEIREECALKKH